MILTSQLPVSKWHGEIRYPTLVDGIFGPGEGPRAGAVAGPNKSLVQNPWGAADELRIREPTPRLVKAHTPWGSKSPYDPASIPGSMRVASVDSHRSPVAYYRCQPSLSSRLLVRKSGSAVEGRRCACRTLASLSLSLEGNRIPVDFFSERLGPPSVIDVSILPVRRSRSNMKAPAHSSREYCPLFGQPPRCVIFGFFNLPTPRQQLRGNSRNRLRVTHEQLSARQARGLAEWNRFGCEPRSRRRSRSRSPRASV